MAYLEIYNIGADNVGVRFRKLSGQPGDYNAMWFEASGWGGYNSSINPVIFSSDGTGYIKSNLIVLYGFQPNTYYNLYAEIRTNTWYDVPAESGADYSRFRTLAEETPVLPYPDVYLEDRGSDYIEIYWSSVSTAVEYDIYLDGRRVTTRSASSSRYYTFTGLYPGTRYQIYVAAWDGSKESDGLLAVLEVETLAAQVLEIPTNFTATSPTATGVALDWNHVPYRTGYEWEIRIGTLIKAWDITTNNYADPTGLEPGTYYTARVRSKDGLAYSGWSPNVSFTTLPGIPKLPTLTKGTQTINSATMNITDYGTATYFEVQGRRDDTTTWSYYSYQAYNPYTATGLISGRTYDFRVRGANTSGYSAWTAPITFNIGTPRPSNWAWEYTILPGYSFWNQVGGNVFLMRASHWNLFTNQINLFRNYKNVANPTYTFTQATTSTTEVGIRTCVNQAIDKVNDMVTSKIPNVVSGETVKASTFTLLRDRLNSL